MENQNYFSGLVGGIKTLLTGLKTTMREFWTPKITERYPENRKEHKMFERFRGQLILPHNELNQHKCVGCGVCQNVCPNDTIIIETKMVEDENGRKKKNPRSPHLRSWQVHVLHALRDQLPARCPRFRQ